jgi:hypothetical protein
VREYRIHRDSDLLALAEAEARENAAKPAAAASPPR